MSFSSFFFLNVMGKNTLGQFCFDDTENKHINHVSASSKLSVRCVRARRLCRNRVQAIKRGFFAVLHAHPPCLTVQPTKVKALSEGYWHV